MDKDYWIGRKRAAIGMARAASPAEARLIHFEMAGRYSLQAWLCPSFMLPCKEPATEGESAVLQSSVRATPRRRPQPGRPDEPPAPGR